MRKNWLLIGVGLLVAVLAIGAIACGDDDDNGNGDGNGNGDDIGDGNGNGNGDLLIRLSVTLTGPDANGTAELTVNGEGILVTISMAGLQSGSAHASHIHDGTCDDIGGIDISLTGIVGDEAGDGSQIDNNTENSLSHYETGHSLAVHEADGSPGAIISCGEIVA